MRKNLIKAVNLKYDTRLSGEKAQKVEFAEYFFVILRQERTEFH